MNNKQFSALTTAYTKKIDMQKRINSLLCVQLFYYFNRKIFDFYRTFRLLYNIIILFHTTPNMKFKRREQTVENRKLNCRKTLERNNKNVT